MAKRVLFALRPELEKKQDSNQQKPWNYHTVLFH
jgi:hypothetical protein